MYSLLSRCSTARGSVTGLFLVVPAKACEFFIFADVSLKVENKGDLFDLVVTLYLFAQI